MADTGEKKYLALESTQQEIIDITNTLALEDDVTNLKNSLNTTISNKTVKIGWNTMKYGAVNSGATTTINGKGIISLILPRNGAYGATSTAVIDGLTLENYQPYENNGYGCYTLHTFNNSITLKGSSEGNLYYVACIE